jgi:hypothetical protein
MLSEIGEHAGVSSVKQADGKLLVSSANAARSLPPVMQSLEEAGCDVRHLEIYTPNLEKLFIHLTGKELRE